MNSTSSKLYCCWHCSLVTHICELHITNVKCVRFVFSRIYASGYPPEYGMGSLTHVQITTSHLRLYWRLPRATSDPSAPSPEEPSARRHRSDLTPTAPAGHSFRDPPPPRHRSPGKAVSLSRLDVLARPRRPLVCRADEPAPQHAPAAPGRRWQSMWHLGPVAAPRPTRATLLRRAARQNPLPDAGRWWRQLQPGHAGHTGTGRDTGQVSDY